MDPTSPSKPLLEPLSPDGLGLQHSSGARGDDGAVTPISRATLSDQDIADDLCFPPLPLCTKTACSDSDLKSPWSRKIILSLDGGGVRGYSSLLVLKRIMFLVEEIELGARRRCKKASGEADNDPSSLYYAPNESSAAYPWSDSSVPSADTSLCLSNGNVTHIEDEYSDDDISASVEKTFASDKLVSAFKPHHYVDYIAGTSTGGLSAIMLGRMEMSIDEALTQYDLVGNQVFGKPRFLHSHFALTNYIKPKYHSRHMEKAMKAVTKFGLAKELSLSKITEDTVSFESNERRCRTIAVAHPSTNRAVTQTAYLFRSYDHLHPSPFSSQKRAPNHLNPGKANRQPIWQVGRATSAAPKYFSSISFDKTTFRDGGMVANNPSKVALDEIDQLHEQKPRVLLSIGTGAVEDDDSERQLTQVSYIKDWSHIIGLVSALATQSENTHGQMLQEVGRINRIDPNAAGSKGDQYSKLKYFRFNVDGGMKKIELDEWDPRKDGVATKATMLKLTKQYLKRPGTHKTLLKCARELVRVRRLRAKTDRWEQFACEFVYYCPEKICRNVTRTFVTREDLRRHAYDAHSFVWDVGVQNHSKLNYACCWDDCEYSGVYVFLDRKEYLEHLKGHHIPEPPFATRRQLEEWLNKGRRDQTEALEIIEASRRTRTGMASLGGEAR
ncbi:FabD/lysophospholipase-like protein [Lophium mytilinum]|uniref:FabD/lysophospholipase-like protein n=1 Tax=Lophium mytilinum TaxID=390894 RepID=A0A6A6QGV4_9PEZI|nr:FabD/lysophospholipase-like protein [Lophium mytilinum]